jgi:glutamyl-tRNA reductase
MRVLFTGINHRTAPVELRECFASGGDTESHLDAFRKRYPGCECVIVSTCNRFELYVARPMLGSPVGDDLLTFLSERFGIPIGEVASASIHREQDQAVSHLFRVCCGLDSMVLGEPQVLGQVKRAYKTAANCGAAGPVLHRVFQQAIGTAKQARTETGIDAGRVSVGSVATDLARQVFADFTDKTVLGIGAGEVSKLTLRHMMGLSPRRLWLVNRTQRNAVELAEAIHLSADQGGAQRWDQLDELLVEADVVVTSTSSPTPILTPERFKPILKRRRYRPLFVIDLAVPRDADERIGSMTNLYLYNIDDLRSVVSHSLGERGEQAKACEACIGPAVTACMSQVTHADLGQLIRKLRTKLHDIGDEERRRTIKKLADRPGSEALSAALDEHTQRLINKILHLPLNQLNQHDGDAPLGFYAAALRRLFDLNEETADSSDDQPADPPPPTASSVTSKKVANLHGE